MAVGAHPIAVNPVTGVLSYGDVTTTANLLDVGQETLSRVTANSSVSIASQAMQLAYFTARKSETTTQVRVYSGGTPSNTLTLGRIGLYLIDSAGAGTLVASTANDTTLLGSASTAYTRSWSVSYSMAAGQRYALGVLSVGTTGGSLVATASLTAAETAVAPRINGRITGLADLPASYADAGVSTSAGYHYGVILP
jgi:hypothetical protein